MLSFLLGYILGAADSAPARTAPLTPEEWVGVGLLFIFLLLLVGHVLRFAGRGLR